MHDSVKNYYGQVLQSTDDLLTDACCTEDALAPHLEHALSRIHEEVVSRYYGCGLVIPPQLEGCRVLDLGSGSGRDCYALAQLVGPSGYVLGVDMTDEQLAVARRHVEYHRERFGYECANTAFRKGYIEQLDELDLPSASFDVIISNCVINLSPDKAAIMAEAHRLLKPGGEMYFADVYADRRVPSALVEDPLLHGECLSGALYWGDFLQLAERSGFADPRLVQSRPLTINDPRLLARVEGIRFCSVTCRLLKLDDLEARQEDYGLAVRYRGSIAHSAESFTLDQDCRFPAGKPVEVSGNTWRMLKGSRFAPHFDFMGDFSKHQGPFAGARAEWPAFSAPAPTSVGGCASSKCC